MQKHPIENFLATVLRSIHSQDARHAGSRQKDAVLDTTFHRLKQLLGNKENLVRAI